MSRVVCLFCNHVNPEGARFCNECGSPTHLRACFGCEAVNNRSATHCYQCGAVLTEPVAPPVSVDSPAQPVAATSSVIEPPARAARDDDGLGGRASEERAEMPAAVASPTVGGRTAAGRMAVAAAAIGVVAVAIYQFGNRVAPPQPAETVAPAPATAGEAAPSAAAPPEAAPATSGPPAPAPSATTAAPPRAVTATPTPPSPAPLAAAANAARECPPAVVALGLCGPREAEEP